MKLYELFLPGKPRSQRLLITRGSAMRETYDFSNARKNPYSKKLKKSITIRVDEDALDYFKGLAGNIEVPYQTLINMYLKDCASHHRKLELNWK